MRVSLDEQAPRYSVGNRWKWVWFIGAVLLAIDSQGLAWAAESSRRPPEPDTQAWQVVRAPDKVFSYRTPQSPAYLRAGALQFGVLGAGMGWYYWNKESNQLDWEYNYDWTTFRAKLEGSGYSFDSNLFDTNALAHTGAGTLYYVGARGNRMSIGGALAVAFASSLVWEVIGEFRERVSVNDMLVTPLAGAALGESLFQLAAFFERGCDRPLNHTLALTFAPTKALADALDGAEVLHSSRCDGNGFPRIGYHRFEFSVGSRVVRSAGAGADVPRVLGELRAKTEVVNLRRFGQPGTGWMSFADGNVSSLELVAAAGAVGVSDFRVDARTLLAGLHFRNIRAGHGGSRGHEFLFGAGLGLEYSRHRYGDVHQRHDPAFVLEVPSMLARYRSLSGHTQWDLGLVVAPSYASIGGFALPAYDLQSDRGELTTVARQHGYNHAFGVSLSPRIEWSRDRLRVGFEVRNDRLFASRVLDREAESRSRREVTELRRRLRVWFASELTGVLGFRLDVGARQRVGKIDELVRQASEVHAGAALVGTY